MAKTKIAYLCRSCGSSSSKWLGRCPECSEWNTIFEEKVSKEGGKVVPFAGLSEPVPITKVGFGEDERIVTGIGELDRVLGGGVVAGSAVLVGGEPGIGKSTLMLQAAGAIAGSGRAVLYVTGEESERQIGIRAERLAVASDELLVYPETSVERIVEAASSIRPAALIIDSIQTIQTETSESSPGSVAQISGSAALLIAAARGLDLPLFLVGHVTKDGVIAGPRILEHMVDTVCYFEGESTNAFRILRAVKNRYGSAMEIGVFEMKEAGLAEVSNPSEIFLAERPENASGSAVVSSLEGTRTILCEIQSLVSPTPFGVPRRTTVGVDYNRVLLLAAVLEKKAGIKLSARDIYIKVAGGLKLNEPAVDLAVIAAIVSNYLDKPMEPRTVVFGEVGLAGELRAVGRAEARVAEALRLGFKRCILPKDNLKDIGKVKGMELIGALMLDEAIEAFFMKG